jgi:two-component system, cell cycle sensor histidine kinase and response regulator CckA
MEQSKSKEGRRALALYEAFKRSNDVMFYCDRDGVIQDVNEAFTRHYGYTRQEAIGKNPRILKSRHSTPELYRRMWASIQDPAKGSWHGQMINRAKDGREVPVILTITAVKDDARKVVGYISNAMDLTEQVALQERVAHSEALATIGEMAAVVAHEIRNPLGSIMMAAKQLAVDSLGAEDRALVLRVMRGESQRLNEALTNFLSFARPREVKLEHGDLNALVSDVAGMVRSNPDLVRSIKVKLSLTASLTPFPMDPDQIRQVVWNIVINAVQAMGERGVLRAATGREAGDAYLRIEDTGPGIPPASLSLIFKPFHTTKHQGTGLGLAIAARIVKAHGGRIDVESKPGKGTAFTVRLPAMAE